MSLSTEAIIAIVGVIVTIPPTIALIWTRCCRRRRRVLNSVARQPPRSEHGASYFLIGPVFVPESAWPMSRYGINVESAV
ncbi:hypothetical protein BGZ63DRAFT_376780 [Mariannaea sp. PMI_226]|nr:hypothetical protein BGZ63DRAFT_376780 [Mariannaea sp. PMI_226]